jgi:hypothetical protein
MITQSAQQAGVTDAQPGETPTVNLRRAANPRGVRRPPIGCSLRGHARSHCFEGVFACVRCATACHRAAASLIPG